MIENRTIYTILDEHGEQSTITLRKLVADVLQESQPDVHTWIQCKYNKVAQKKPWLNRRQKGNLVRALSEKEAEKLPRYKEMFNELFGF